MHMLTGPAAALPWPAKSREAYVLNRIVLLLLDLDLQYVRVTSEHQTWSSAAC
jgi:hypothetical protein